MNKGFTLIEVTIILAIAIVILSIVVFNASTQRQNSALVRSAQNLSLNLRKIENYALSSKVFKTEGIPCGWGAHFNGQGSDNYIVFADLALARDCSDQDFIRSGDGSEDLETVYFENGITINSLSGDLSDVVFYPPKPTIRFTPGQTEASIILINENSLTKEIRINTTGFISSP